MYLIRILNQNDEFLGYYTTLSCDWYENYNSRDALTSKKEYATTYGRRVDVERDAKSFVSNYYNNCKYEIVDLEGGTQQ